MGLPLDVGLLRVTLYERTTTGIGRSAEDRDTRTRDTRTTSPPHPVDPENRF